MNIFIVRNSQFTRNVQSIVNYSFFAAVLIGLYFTTWANYLLFHFLAEVFSIVVAFSIFVIAGNSKKYIHNSYLLFVGIAYLFIGAIDLLHTLAYKGMPIFTDYDYYANQLWIGARFMESITLLLAFYFFGHRKGAEGRVGIRHLHGSDQSPDPEHFLLEDFSSMFYRGKRVNTV